MPFLIQKTNKKEKNNDSLKKRGFEKSELEV